MPVPVSLYINLAQNPGKIAIGPLLLDGTAWESAPPATARTSGTVTTRLHFFDDSGTTGAPTRITVTAADIVFAVRKTPDAEDLLVLQTVWSEEGDAGQEYYETEIDWNVVPGTWNKGETEAANPVVDVIADGRPVGIPLSLVRGAYDEGAAVTSPQLYVKTTANQGLTGTQQTNAITNLGGTSVGRAVFQAASQAAARAAIGSGTSSFDPASPGNIGTTTPGAITATDFTLGTNGTDPLIVGDVGSGVVNYYGTNNFRQITYFGSAQESNFDASGNLTLGGNTLHLGGENVQFATFGAAFVGMETAGDGADALGLGQASDVTFNTLAVVALNATNANVINVATDTLAANSADLGSLNVNGNPQSGTNTGDQTTISGNAGTATALQTARTIFGQSFNGSANIGGGTITLSGNFTTSGAFPITLTATASTTLTLPTTGTLVTLAGTENLTNKTLTSPVMTAPVLGTPASGNLANCDAASPTAKGVIELATRAEVLAAVSTTLGVTVQELMFLLMSRCLREMPKGSGAWTVLTSGTAAGGGATQHVYGAQLRGSAATTGGYALTDTVNNGHIHAGRSRGRHRYAVDLGKLVWCSFRVLTDSDFWNANAVLRFVFGKPGSGTGSGIGDPASVAFGVKQTGTGALQIIHYNSSLTTTATSFTPTYAQEYDVDLISYGNGTVECFVNGSSVGTSTGFSTALLSNAVGVCTQFEVDQITSFVSPQPIAYFTPGNIFAQA